jgi:hypothetical protein
MNDYREPAKAAKAVGFKVLEDYDLATACPVGKPWYAHYCQCLSVSE